MVTPPGYVVTDTSGFHEVKSGACAAIILSPKAKAEWDKVVAGTDARAKNRKRTLERYFQEFCDREPPLLNNDQYKRQGSYSDGMKGGSNITVYEFKAFAWRLYGGIVTIKDKKTFVGMKVDPDKKQDKADPDILTNTAKDIGKLDEYQNARTGDESGSKKAGQRRKRKHC